MKVCIVTVYDSINSGSYWQAYALGKVLEQQGAEVLYYERQKRGASSSTKQKIKKVIMLSKKAGIPAAIDYVNTIHQFSNSIEAFRIVKSDSPVLSTVDYFILGSDTIWNMNSEYFKRNKSTFWGDIFEKSSVFSYAGSIANTDTTLLFNDPSYSESIKKWKHISARDSYTQKTLQRLTEAKVELVCDPTLLLKEVDYRDNIRITDKGFDYIFLYMFEPLSKQQDFEIRDFAVKHGLKIVCGTFRNVTTVADVYIVNSPNSFMSYILDASYVITDTFHGTLFSINFHKNLVVVDRNKNKVNEVLDRFYLTNRLIASDGNIGSILSMTIDYDSMDSAISDYRDHSLSYLKRSLNMSKN